MASPTATDDRPRRVDAYVGRVGFERAPKRVRALLAGTLVADSEATHLVWTGDPVPVYAFPEADVAGELVTRSDDPRAHPVLGRIERLDVEIDDRRIEEAAWRVVEPADDAPDTRGFVVLDWDAMDTWRVEDDVARVHPRDPYHRIDVHASSRHVVVEHAGAPLADSHRPMVLFETGLPPRFYLPRADVEMDLLEPSDTATRCAYKGTAEHLHCRVDGELAEDLAWTYPFPNPQVARIQDLVCFYDERVDQVTVDGDPRGPLQTPWA